MRLLNKKWTGSRRITKSNSKVWSGGETIYEFEVGTNPGGKLGNSAQEDEKILGAIYVSFGQNKTTKVHAKMVRSSHQRDIAEADPQY